MGSMEAEERIRERRQQRVEIVAAEERIRKHRLQANEAYMTYLRLQDKMHDAEMALVELRRNWPEQP